MQPPTPSVQSSSTRSGQLTVKQSDATPHETSQLQAVLQSAVEQLPVPLHSTAHRPVPHVTLEQLPGPLHVTFAAPRPPVTLVQLVDPLQPMVRSPLPALTLVQLAKPWQSRSHAPAPHDTLRQLWDTPQVIAQSAASTQSMPLRHARSVVQSILQLNPAGHVIARVHRPGFTLQSTAQVFASRSHDVHCAGHIGGGGPSIGGGGSIGRLSGTTPASIGVVATHRPSLQMRPDAQGWVSSHEKSALRWLTEQLPPAATAMMTSAVHSATSFTASLQS